MGEVAPGHLAPHTRVQRVQIHGGEAGLCEAAAELRKATRLEPRGHLEDMGLDEEEGIPEGQALRQPLIADLGCHPVGKIVGIAAADARVTEEDAVGVVVDGAGRDLLEPLHQLSLVPGSAAQDLAQLEAAEEGKGTCCRAEEVREPHRESSRCKRRATRAMAAKMLFRRAPGCGRRNGSDGSEEVTRWAGKPYTLPGEQDGGVPITNAAGAFEVSRPAPGLGIAVAELDGG